MTSVHLQGLHSLRACNLPIDRDTDPYEPPCIHFAALDPQDNVVGTIRLILCSEKEDHPDFGLRAQLRMITTLPRFVRKGFRYWKGRLEVVFENEVYLVVIVIKSKCAFVRPSLELHAQLQGQALPVL